VKETFQDKGWEYGQDGHFDNEVVPLLTEFGDYRVVFFKWDPNTGECWFELRDEARRSMGYTCGASRTYRRWRSLGRCSKATEPP